ncbi:13717_t:CDS:1, partial [Acaulospora morrowiae]
MSSSILTTSVADHFINLAHTIGILTDPFVTPIENVAKFTFNSTFPGVYQYFAEVLEGYKSPFVDRLPLMDPFHVVLIAIGYLMTIFLGKQYMSQRQKLSVKGLSALHNFLMVSLSAYMCTMIWVEAWKNGYTLFANPEDRSEKGFQVQP